MMDAMPKISYWNKNVGFEDVLVCYAAISCFLFCTCGFSGHVQ